MNCSELMAGHMRCGHAVQSRSCNAAGQRSGASPGRPCATGAVIERRRHAGAVNPLAWQALEADLRLQQRRRLARERDADLAVLLTAELGASTLADLLRGSVGEHLTCQVRAPHRPLIIAGRVLSVGFDLLLLDDECTRYAIALAHLCVVNGCQRPPSQEVSLTGRLGLTAHLRGLMTNRQPVTLITEHAAEVGLTVAAVGRDWVQGADGRVFALATITLISAPRRALDPS